MTDGMTSTRESRTSIWVAVAVGVPVLVLIGFGVWALTPRMVTTTTISYEISGSSGDHPALVAVFEQMARDAERTFEPMPQGGMMRSFGSSCGTGSCDGEGLITVGGVVSRGSAFAFMSSVAVPSGYTIRAVDVRTGTARIWGCPKC